MKDQTVLSERIEKALDQIRPYLSEDLGGVEVVKITSQGELQIRWLGNCEHCKMSEMTLKAGIENAIRERIPEIKAVIPIN